MRLSKEAIKEFKKIYYDEFGETISEKEAQKMGANLLSLFRMIYRPVLEVGEQNPEDKNNKRSESV